MSDDTRQMIADAEALLNKGGKASPGQKHAQPSTRTLIAESEELLQRKNPQRKFPVIWVILVVLSVLGILALWAFTW